MIFSAQNIIISIILFSFFLDPLKSCASQDQMTIFLTMEDAVYRALTRNNQVRSSNFSVKKADWDKKHAWSLLFPTLQLSSRYTRIDDETSAERDAYRDFMGELGDEMSRVSQAIFPGISAPVFPELPETAYQDSYYTSLDLSMPLYNGSLLYGISIANTNVDMARQMNSSIRDEIIFQVIRGYLNVLKNKDILQLQLDYLDLSRLNYERAERLHKADRYSVTEVLRWKVDFQQQRSIVVASQSDVRRSMTALTRMLNIGLHEKIETEAKILPRLVEESEKMAGFSDGTILAMINISDTQLIKANDSLSAASSNEKISKLLYRNTYASYMPQVTMNYSYAWRENDTIDLDDYNPETVMVNFSMPLFSSFQNFTNTKSAYYEYRKSQEDFSDHLQSIRSALTDVASRLINLKTQRELATTTVEYNEHNYSIVEQRKNKGLVSNIDFIDAKLNLQNAKLNEISTRYDFISTLVELYYLLGRIEDIYKTI